MIQSRKESEPAKPFVLRAGPRQGANFYRDPEARFTIVASDPATLERLLTADIFSLATAFINGDFTVQGDIFSAIRFFRNHQHASMWNWLLTVAAKLQSAASGHLSGRATCRDNIQFHYDRSNEFYRQFLDSRMVYSAACFSTPDTSLEDAQQEKLHRICAALDLRPGQRFLDIGCGWGALIVFATENFGVHATGCTLSHGQFEYVQKLIREKELTERITVLEKDYRDLEGCFDRIASVGMFEHVGPAHLREYFKKVYSLLAEDGRFLNSGIVRPEYVSDDPETLFLQKSVFPGGQLVHLAEIFREAERAGFSTLEMQDLRTHYAMTCRAWVKRLQANAASCIRLVGEVTYRVWLLYLAGSAVSFENGQTDVAQLTFAKGNAFATRTKRTLNQV